MTLEQLGRLEIDTGKSIRCFFSRRLIIPTLEEFLATVTSRRQIPVIEIKEETVDAADFDKLVKLLEKYQMEKTARIISFHYDPLKEMKKRLKDIHVLYLTYEISQKTINRALELGPNSGLNCSYASSSVTAENVLKAHQLGLSVGAWTVPKSQFSRMAEFAIDFITTDD